MLKILRSGPISLAVIVGGALGTISLSGCTSNPSPAPDVTNSAAPSSFAGEWTEPASEGETRITFDENGEFTGFDGCNTRNGSFQTSTATITLTYTSGTESACSKDVWLEKATSAYLEGDSLVMTDAKGTQLGQLYKTES